MSHDFRDDLPHGGAVEPARPTPATERHATVREQPATERFELHNPLTEVTYRARTIEEIVATAEKVGATRFHAIAVDGKRTPVVKTEGEWKRGERSAPTPQQNEDRHPDVFKPVPIQIDMGSTPPITKRSDLEAGRSAYVEGLEAALHERYLIKRGSVTLGDVTVDRTVYHHRGEPGRIAFSESASRLVTNSSHPSVPRSMVDLAEVRGWHPIRVSGHENFKRLVWQEASLRNMKTLGYEPQPAEAELLRQEREARQAQRVAPTAETPAGPATNKFGQGSWGRKALLVAIEAVLVAKRMPVKQREAVMKAAAEHLTQRLRNGQTHKVKVYDKAAPTRQPDVAPTPEMPRSRDRAGPIR